MELTVMSMVCPGLTNDGMYRDGRDVLELRRDVCGNRDAQLRQHVVERLHGERRLAGLIAGAVEADDQPITHQLVRSHPLYLRQVLDAFGFGERTGQQQEEEGPA